MQSKNTFITLRDGRRLAYSEYGDPEGKPIFYFHGFPGSHHEVEYLGTAIGALHLRIIAPDRPGFGVSDFQPGRKFGDWPSDVIELADALGIKEFAVLGASGGGPYVLAGNDGGFLLRPSPGHASCPPRKRSISETLGF